MATAPVTMKELQSPVEPTWCPGCGDYGILNAVKRAMVQLGLRPHEVFFVSGIGCGSKLPDYIRGNGFNSLHGRPVPIAQGFLLAHHDMKVIVVDGDGDNYGIGGNHWLHIMRRNPNITHIVQNNMVYGLTKGQYAPTSMKGYVSTTSPEGTIEWPVNPIAIALAAGATFIARGFSGDPKHLADLIAKGIQHKGYALIDVFQPCVIFNRVNTYDWFRERIYKLEDDPNYDPHDRDAAWAKAHEWGDRIPIGVFYINEEVPTLEEQIPALAEKPLYQHEIPPKVEDLEALKVAFM
jgi:2-oxoglutarate ferredoxin oxidoreductase subunit beta